MMKNFPLLLFLLASLLCRGQQSRQEVVDSLKQAFALAGTDADKAKFLRPICYNLRQISPDSALSFLQEASAFAEKNGYKSLKTTALYLLGFHYAAIKADNKTAFQYYIDAYKIAEQSSDHLNMGSCQTGMGGVYMTQGQTLRALDCYQKAVTNYSAAKADRLLAIAHSAVAESQVGLNNFDEAVLSIKSGLAIAERIKDDETKARLLMVMSTALQKKKNFREAAQFSQRASDIYCKAGNNQYCAFCLTLQADQNLELGNIQDALRLALEAQSVCEKYGLDLEMITVYGVLDRVYHKLRDFEKAYYYRDKFMQARDSTLNQSKAADIALIELKYIQDKKDAVAAEELRRQQIIRNGFVAGFGVMLLFAAVFFFQRNKIAQEKKRSDALLLNILPAETAEELKSTGAAQAKHYESVTVMFTDFKNFTQVSEKMSAEELVKEIHHYFSEFDKIVARHKLEKIKTIGDSYMCAAGLPTPSDTHAVDAVRAALEIRDLMAQEKIQREKEGRLPLEIRIGVHSGAAISGVVGINKFAYDIWGDTVNIAARMESSGEAGKLNISGATYALVKDKFRCIPRGKIEAKHKGLIEMYFVEGET